MRENTHKVLKRIHKSFPVPDRSNIEQTAEALRQLVNERSTVSRSQKSKLGLMVVLKANKIKAGDWLSPHLLPIATWLNTCR